MPPLGRFIDVGGARIQYLERGAGPPLLLIHGLAGHARLFTHSLVDRLVDEFRVIVMERPGSGYSTRAKGAPAGPRADAAVVARFIRALELDRPLLLGHSLGGAVALATAVEHPEVVGGLALIAPLTHPMDEVPEVFRPLDISSPTLRRLVASTVATPASMLRSERTLEELFAPEPVPHDFAIAGGGLLALRPQQVISASTDLVAAPGDMPWLLERYGTIDVPVGILYGTGDRILDPGLHGEGMRSRLPRLQLELIDGGHMLPLTQPGRVADLVRKVALASASAVALLGCGDGAGSPPSSVDEMQRVISADGTPVAYWRSGQGPPLLLVHGATADHSTTWRFVRPLLERHFTVLAMDRRGRGASGDAEPYELRREAEDVAAVVDAIGGPVHVLGHSYGGLSAIEAALLTTNIDRLVLYEGVPLRGSDAYDPGIIDRLEEMLAAGDVEGMLIAFYRDVVMMAPEDIELLRGQDEAWQVRLRNAATLPRELRWESGYVFAPDRFRGMRSPTLFLVGGDSPSREFANAEGVADALPNAEVVVLPGQEHTAMYSAPDELVAALLRFLAD